jgi:uncharacterized protein with HEPN domain
VDCHWRRPSKTLPRALLLDQYIDLLETFTCGIEYASFESDRKTVYAVVRALEIISEATRRQSREFKERRPYGGLLLPN